MDSKEKPFKKGVFWQPRPKSPDSRLPVVPPLAAPSWLGVTCYRSPGFSTDDTSCLPELPVLGGEYKGAAQGGEGT